jgi:AcrR family transcriptional regulator
LHVTTPYVSIVRVTTARHRKPPTRPRAAPGRRYRGESLGERRAERRRLLIEAGIETFGTRGYHSVTVREVCGEAGLTERYFYESFRDREQLFSAVYEQLNAELQERLTAAVTAEDGEPRRAAREGLRAYFSQIRSDPKGARIMLIEVFGVSADMDRLSRRTAVGFVEMVRRMLAPRLRDGLDAELIANGLVGGVIFSAMRWVLSGYAQPLDAIVENAATIFTALLEAQA